MVSIREHKRRLKAAERAETKADRARRIDRERELREQHSQDIEAGRLDTFTGRRTPIFSDE